MVETEIALGVVSVILSACILLVVCAIRPRMVRAGMPHTNQALIASAIVLLVGEFSEVLLAWLDPSLKVLVAQVRHTIVRVVLLTACVEALHESGQSRQSSSGQPFS